MRFFVWLFSVRSRHYRDTRRYENGGVGARIFSIIISLFFIGIALGAEYWFLSSLMTEGSLGGGIAKFFALILIGCLFVAAFIAALEYCGVYAFTAFAMAITGIVYKAEKRKAVLEKSKIKTVNLETELEKTPDLKYRKLDIFTGIFQIISAIGLIAGVIAVAVLTV